MALIARPPLLARSERHLQQNVPRHKIIISPAGRVDSAAPRRQPTKQMRPTGSPEDGRNFSVAAQSYPPTGFRSGSKGRGGGILGPRGFIPPKAHIPARRADTP